MKEKEEIEFSKHKLRKTELKILLPQHPNQDEKDQFPFTKITIAFFSVNVADKTCFPTPEQEQNNKGPQTTTKGL